MSASPRSSASVESFDSEHNRNPDMDDTAALILVQEPEDPDQDRTPFDFSSDDEVEEDDHVERLKSSSIPPLSSSAVFLYLLTPLLKLGAILVVDEGGAIPLRLGLPAVIVFAVLCGFTRQIWYMLARYVRRSDMEEVLIETFARGRRRERARQVIRDATRFSIGLFRVLLAVVYLRASVDVLLPLLPKKVLVSTRYPLTISISLVLAPICYVPSINTTAVLSASWMSIATFVAWIACTAYAHAKGILTFNPVGESLGPLWEGLSVIAFAFTTTSTLPLYAALRGKLEPGAPKPKRSQSFWTLTILSVGIATLLIIPLAFFVPITSPLSTQSPSSSHFKALVAFLNTATLALTIPSIIITTPPLPLPLSVRRATNFPVSKFIVYFIAVLLAMSPMHIAHVLSNILLVLAFVSTYVLPAFIHITIHTFRRPLSIVLPPATTPATPTFHIPQTSDSQNDELLQRKERALQRRRLAKRIVWDIGVWILLLPIGGGGLGWMIGKIAGRW